MSNPAHLASPPYLARLILSQGLPAESIGQHTPHPVMPSASATPTMVSGESQGLCFQKEIKALPLCLKMRGPYTNLRPGGGPGGFTVRPTGFTLTPFGEATEWMTGATAMRAGVMLTPSGLHKHQTQISLLSGNITWAAL